MENNIENIPNNEEEAILEEAEPAQVDEEKIKEAKKDIISGSLWCVGGLIFTYLSYYFAKGGTTYTVATGAIVWGAVQGVRGLIDYLTQLRRAGNELKFKKAICYGIVGLAAVVGLAVYGWRFVHRNDLKPLDYEQTVSCPIGLSMVFPAGCEKVDEDFFEETDSTFAGYYYSTVSAENVYCVDVTAGLADTTGMEGYLYSEQFYHDTSVDYYGKDNILSEGFIDINGIRAYKTTGISEIGENSIENTYEFIYNSSKITVTCIYPGNEIDSQSDASADDFVRSIKFNNTI